MLYTVGTACERHLATREWVGLALVKSGFYSMTSPLTRDKWITAKEARTELGCMETR